VRQTPTSLNTGCATLILRLCEVGMMGRFNGPAHEVGSVATREGLAAATVVCRKAEVMEPAE